MSNFTVISEPYSAASPNCFMPIGQCHQFVLRPDDFASGTPTQYTATPTYSATNFSVGDTIVFTTIDGEVITFTFIGSAITPNDIYQIPLGVDTNTSLLALLANLALVPYIEANYTISGLTISAIYFGSEYYLTINGYDSTGADLVGFAQGGGAPDDLKLLADYCVNFDIYLIDRDCEEWALPANKRLKQRLIDTLCVVPSPDYTMCDNVPEPAYQFKVSVDLHASIRNRLFPKHIPANCYGGAAVNFYEIPEMWRTIKFNYYACHRDSTGFSNPQALHQGYQFNVSDSDFDDTIDWTDKIAGYCAGKPMTERPRTMPLLTCPDTCQYVTFWASSNTTYQLEILIRTITGGFAVYTVPLGAVNNAPGFYGYNYTIAQLYDIINATFPSPPLPPIEHITVFSVRTDPSQSGPGDELYWLDNQLCCKLCHTTLVYKNALGAFESIAVQCEQSEYDWAVQTYCNRINCADERNGRDGIPNAPATRGKWVGGKNVSRTITIKSMPYIFQQIAQTDTPNLREYKEKYIQSILKAKDHWLLIGGTLHKLIVESSNYETGVQCWEIKAKVALPINNR